MQAHQLLYAMTIYFAMLTTLTADNSFAFLLTIPGIWQYPQIIMMINKMERLSIVQHLRALHGQFSLDVDGAKIINKTSIQ